MTEWGPCKTARSRGAAAPPWFVVGVLLLATCALTGCGNIPTEVDRRATVLAGKPGGSTADPTVTAADPASASQDTTLDVKVIGSGFDRGSTAQWAVDGVPSTKVQTNSTKYVSSTQLTANITIAADADTTLYDVIVLTARGKKGIGTEIFAVKVSNASWASTTQTALVDDAPVFRVSSDGRGSYVNSEQCVSAQAGSGGWFQLRPVANGAVDPAGVNCNLQTWDGGPLGRGRRFLTLDLSTVVAPDPGASARGVVDLDSLVLSSRGDSDGPTLEEAPARFIAEDAFATKARSSYVEILVVQVQSDGSTTQTTQWKLVYRREATVTFVDRDTRIISALPGNAVADLYERIIGVTQNGTDIVVFRGAYDLPFRITATK